MNEYERFFWWLEGFLSVDNDIDLILKKMEEVKKQNNIPTKDKDPCFCGYNCGGEDCCY
jgi:hypothetical protein